jgi:hypothetical protein
MSNLVSKLNYSNVVATLAVFISLGGASYAAMTLPRNSVGTKQLRGNAVTSAKIRDLAVTGPKIDLASLGTVPSAAHSIKAGSATHAEFAKSARMADTALTTANANALAGLPSSAFGTVLLSHLNIPTATAETTHWASITGIAPTSSSAFDVEMAVPYYSDFYATNFTVFSRKGLGVKGHVDIRLYVNSEGSELACSVPSSPPCVNSPTTKVKVPGGSVLAIRVHEEPEGVDIPPLSLAVSFELIPSTG